MGKAHECCGGRKVGIPQSKKFFVKEKSFLQEKCHKFWEIKAVLPHPQLSKYIWSQEGSFFFDSLCHIFGGAPEQY